MAEEGHGKIELRVQEKGEQGQQVGGSKQDRVHPGCAWLWRDALE